MRSEHDPVGEHSLSDGIFDTRACTLLPCSKPHEMEKMPNTLPPALVDEWVVFTSMEMEDFSKLAHDESRKVENPVVDTVLGGFSTAAYGSEELGEQPLPSPPMAAPHMGPPQQGFGPTHQSH